MGFQDLPEGWVDLPLDEPQLVADVLDLVVSERDRRAGALAVLLCDALGRLVTPVLISDLDELAPEAARREALEVVMQVMRGEGSVLVAVARRDGLSITADDHIWARAAAAACEPGVALLGVHVVTSSGSREIPFDPRAA
jgi:hypothetical protein